MSQVPAGDPLPLRIGDFVWCAFPTAKSPAQPGELHVAYVIDIEMPDHGPAIVIVAYTTSTGLDFPVLPIGVYAFSAAAALALGQSKSFRLDLRRLARLPVTAKWFPSIAEGEHGVLGRADKKQRATLRRELDSLITRHLELMEKVAGPP